MSPRRQWGWYGKWLNWVVNGPEGQKGRGNEMKGCLRVVRGTEVKLALPGPSITVKSDGTLWMSGNPILGIDDPAEKTRVAALAKAGRYNEIPADYYTRLGDNPNGLWTGTDAEWAAHPAKIEQDRLKMIKNAEEAKQVRIYLSSRGWGDYSACEWVGDITRPDAAILAECRDRLTKEHDVDQPNLPDQDILSLIADARTKWEAAPALRAARSAAETVDIKRKVDNGFCFACGSYCYGDCGDYSRNPVTQYRREIQEAAAEANYGVDD